MTPNAVGRRCAVALALCSLMAVDAAAVQVTLDLTQSNSYFLVNGGYGGYSFSPQDDPAFPTPGVTDGDPAHPSNRTNLSGTITVDVDNILAPTTIQIVSSNLDANITGTWLPEPQPEDDEPSAGTDPQPAAPADVGIKIVADFGVPECCDIAYAVLRDVSYDFVTADLTTLAPIVEPVNPQGEFSSLSQLLSYRGGFFEYWADPFLLNSRERDDVSDDHFPNQHDVDLTVDPPGITPIPNAPKSSYVVSGNLVTLTIPVELNVDSPPSDVSYYISGQLLATFEISAGQDGDHNGDGLVNAADYVGWRKLPSQFGGDPAGYNEWYANFGEGGPGGSSAVPEPATVALLVVGLTALSLHRRGR